MTFKRGRRPIAGDERTWVIARWACVVALLPVIAILLWDLTRSSGPLTTTPATLTSSTSSSAPTRPPSVPLTTNAGPPAGPESTGLTVVAADAIIRFYFAEAENHLKTTGDGSAVTRWSDPACRPCQQTVAFFTTHNAANRLLSGDFRWHNIDVRQVRLISNTSAVVDVNADVRRHTITTRPGAPPRTYPGGVAYLKVSLTAHTNHWVIFDLEPR